jgi:hypothetical protein
MEPEPKWEHDFLKGLGFDNDHQLRRYLYKLCAFLRSLDPPEKRVFLASMPTKEDAWQVFNNLEITEKELEDFLREREGDCGDTIMAAHKVICDDCD